MVARCMMVLLVWQVLRKEGWSRVDACGAKRFGARRVDGRRQRFTLHTSSFFLIRNAAAASNRKEEEEELQQAPKGRGVAATGR